MLLYDLPADEMALDVEVIIKKQRRQSRVTKQNVLIQTNVTSFLFGSPVDLSSCLGCSIACP